jgi:hypothetical protein
LGGFFLTIGGKEAIHNPETATPYQDSLGVFDRKGMSLNEKIVNGSISIHVFNKNKFPVDNLIQFSTNDFIIGIGTLIYNRKIGHDALTKLYEDFSEDWRFLPDLFGHYCVIISKNGKIFLFNDGSGLLRVYTDKTRQIFSNSFLALLKTLKKRSFATQELYEYIQRYVFWRNDSGGRNKSDR